MKTEKLVSIISNLAVLTAILLLFRQCTENPFDHDDGKIQDRHVVQGTLSLSDTSSRDNILVWLSAGGGLTSVTNSHGFFSLELPETPQFQGLNGIFNLYYYLGNYCIDSSQVFIREGQFEYGLNDINENGRIRNAPVLKKLLDIHTSIDPSGTPVNEAFIFSATIELKASLLQSATVRTLENKDGVLTALIFLRKNNGSVDLLNSKLLSLLGGNPSLETVSAGGTIIWEGLFSVPSGYFEPGEYEVVPYIEIIQRKIPEELLSVFGERVHEMSYDYLNIPFKQTPALLQVSSSGQ